MRFFKTNYLDQFVKRSDDKRQLKIIRLKKDDNFSTITSNDGESGVPSEASIDMALDNPNAFSGGRNDRYLGEENQPIMNKRALKILRLKKDISIPKVKTLNRLYLRHFNPDKRSLKIIRLKKNQREENLTKAKYLEFMNPAVQVWHRLGRSGPDFGRTVREDMSFGSPIDSELSPDDILSLYNRFY